MAHSRPEKLTGRGINVKWGKHTSAGLETLTQLMCSALSSALSVNPGADEFIE